MRNLLFIFLVIFSFTFCEKPPLKTVDDSEERDEKVEKFLSIAQAHNNYDSILYYTNKGLELIDTNEQSYLYLDMLLRQSVGWFKKMNYDTAIYLTKKSYLKSITEKKLDFSAKSASRIGSYLRFKKEFHKSRKWFDKSIFLYKNLEDTVGICEPYLGIGNIFNEKTQSDSAILYYKLAMRHAKWIEEKQNTFTTAVSNIAIVYLLNRDFENALEYSIKAVEMAKKSKDDSKIIMSLNVLGAVYMGLNENNKAVDKFNEAISLNENINSKRLFNSFENLGIIYKREKQYDKALKYYKKAFNLLDNDSLKMGEIAVNMGNVYKELGMLDSAFHYFQLVEKTILNSDDITKKQPAYVALFGAYKMVNKHEKAGEYMFEAYKLQNTLFTEQKAKILEEEHAKYQYQSQRDSITILTKQKEIDQHKIDRQRNTIISFIAATLGLLFILWLLDKNRKKEKERRVAQENLNELLEEKAKEFEEKNSQLLDEIESKDEKLQSPQYLSNRFIHLTSGEKPLIRLGDIYYIKSNDNLVMVATKTDEYREWQTLKIMSEQLPKQIFVQVHKSYIINLLNVKSVLPKKVILTNGEHIVITKTYKKAFQEALKRFKL